MYSFEFDEQKSQSNLQKHGIDFIDAQILWRDPNLIAVEANSDTESRYLIVGLIDNKHWSAVITYRGKNIRIISVRRSRKQEIALYGS